MKSYKAGAAGEPSFPADFEIYDSVTLQVTDFKSNHNKYYALELHVGKVGKKDTYRVRKMDLRTKLLRSEFDQVWLTNLLSSILTTVELMTCILILMLVKKRRAIMIPWMMLL